MTDLVQCKRCGMHVYGDPPSMKAHADLHVPAITSYARKDKGVKILFMFISITGTACLLKLISTEVGTLGITLFTVGFFWGVAQLTMGILSFKKRDPILDNFEALDRGAGRKGG